MPCPAQHSCPIPCSSPTSFLSNLAGILGETHRLVPADKGATFSGTDAIFCPTYACPNNQLYVLSDAQIYSKISHMSTGYLKVRNGTLPLHRFVIQGNKDNIQKTLRRNSDHSTNVIVWQPYTDPTLHWYWDVTAESKVCSPWTVMLHPV